MLKYYFSFSELEIEVKIQLKRNKKYFATTPLCFKSKICIYLSVLKYSVCNILFCHIISRFSPFLIIINFVYLWVAMLFPVCIYCGLATEFYDFMFLSRHPSLCEKNVSENEDYNFGWNFLVILSIQSITQIAIYWQSNEAITQPICVLVPLMYFWNWV